MAHPLDGPRIKVIRAREHLDAFHLRQLRFFESKPYSVSQVRDPESGKRVYRIHVLRDIPRNQFAAFAGDAVHNLRSALDHLVFQLADDVKALPTPDTEDTQTQFPIFRTEPGYDARGVSRLWRVGPGAAAVIRQLQPFHLNEPRTHPLWFIRELDNGDKHRSLAVTAVAAQHFTQRIHHRRDESGVFNLTLSLEDIKDGGVIAELQIFPPEAQIRVESTFQFEAAFTAPTVQMTLPRLFVAPFLNFLCNRVDAVIKCFEPFYSTGTYNDNIVVPDVMDIFHRDPPDEEPWKWTDEAHEEWTTRSKERIDGAADEAWPEAKPIRMTDNPDSLQVDGANLLAAPKIAAAKGFIAGSEMSLERAEENRASGRLGFFESR